MKFSHRRCLSLICLALGGLLLLQTIPGRAQEPPPREPRTTILEFSREYCPMCEYMKKVLGKVKAKYGDQIEVRQLYYDPDAKLYRQYQVVFVPTQVFLDASGQEVFRHTGVFTEYEVAKKLLELKLIKPLN